METVSKLLEFTGVKRRMRNRILATGVSQRNGCVPRKSTLMLALSVLYKESMRFVAISE